MHFHRSLATAKINNTHMHAHALFSSPLVTISTKLCLLQVDQMDFVGKENFACFVLCLCVFVCERSVLKKEKKKQ
eukprot:m.233517 g.233517  ORF g.233517 m.233517 type:complete len:75 (-) comp13907_c1_seq7:198-422(-)